MESEIQPLEAHETVDREITIILLEEIQGKLRLGVSSFAERLGVRYRTLQNIYTGKTKRISSKIRTTAQEILRDLDRVQTKAISKDVLSKREAWIVDNVRHLTEQQQKDFAQQLTTFLAQNDNSVFNKSTTHG